LIIQVESERVNVVTLIFAHHPCGNVFQKHDDSQAIFYGCTPYISRTLNIVSNAQAQSTAIGYQISSGSSWSSLDPSQPHHLWLLHVLFLDVLNADLADFRFREMWNRHGVSTTQMQYKSPLVRTYSKFRYSLWPIVVPRMCVSYPSPRKVFVHLQLSIPSKRWPSSTTETTSIPPQSLIFRSWTICSCKWAWHRTVLCAMNQ
jgi:hypothetical protein